ncbi:diguanylate cyclase domain-containing protein [Clostridium lacusfryxellense]|uniref:diguanylate cyclase domain-containing protein n=1 Tax=Clostridium lacusfryxellense TaxID=205328 RepID=UPI001C0CDFE0|nr:diguanylate cyclase [Clostridium lacusfryxellense]MBU3111256.1 diguanylate cyclase [Clostridium lacusfryxellense]
MSLGDNIRTMLFSLLCICFIFYLFIGIYSYKKDKKSKVNLIFFSLCTSTSIWTIGYAFMLISPNIRIANIWRIVSVLGICFFCGLWLSFAFALKGTKKENHIAKIQYPIYIISLIFTINNLFYIPSKSISKEAYGFIDIFYSTSTIGVVYSIYIAVVTAAGFVVMYSQLIGSNKNRVKKQMRIILVTCSISFSLAATSCFILPLLGIVIFQFVVLAFTIGMGGMWYAINKHKMLSISYELVSEYIFEAVNEPIFILDEEFVVKKCNEAALNITCHNNKELEGNSLIKIINFRNFKFETIMQLGKIINIEVDLLRKNEEELVCDLSATVVYDEYKDVLGILIILHDVSERKSIAEMQKKYTLKLERSNLKLQNEITDRQHAEDQIRHFVYYDALTEIFNRKKMLEDLETILNDEKEKSAILFIDLDKFKSANDNYGHEAGDYILKIAAKRLMYIIRSTDTIYRIGGDEFIVILRNLRETSNAEKIAEDALKTLGLAFNYKQNLLFIGASIGISIFPEHGIDADTLIKIADSCMYEVKRKGGNGFKIYSTEIKKDNLSWKI